MHRFDCFQPITQLCVFLGIVGTVVMGMSRRDGDYLMGCLCIVVHTCFSLAQHGEVSGPPQQVLDELPQNIRAALSTFDLMSSTTIYAICPTCHCTYAPSPNGSKYPSRCTNIPSPKALPCDEPLLRSSINESTNDDADDKHDEHDEQDERGQNQPIKPFVYHSIHDFIAGLLADPELEQYMDDVVDNARRFQSDHSGSTTDIWQGEFLQTMEGPSPGTLFLDRQGGGRYAFAFNYDSFAVEGLRLRGSTNSVGLLAMTCLNLPPHLRQNHLYQAGIIPGTKQPSLTELNHYTRIIVDDFANSWKHGIFYPQTALRPNGRLTHSIIAAGVMDLPAARHASSMAGITSHHICTVCTLKYKVNLGDTNYEKWVLRDSAVLRNQAIKWRDAETEKDRVSIFNEYGVRWSELWRLPYWNPVRQLVVDVMHCILENNCSYHFRELLALTRKSADTRSPPEPPAFYNPFTDFDDLEEDTITVLGKEGRNQILLAHKALTQTVDEADTEFTTLQARLKTCKIVTLAVLCRDVSIECESYDQNKKAQFVEALVTWVRLTNLVFYWN